MAHEERLCSTCVFFKRVVDEDGNVHISCGKETPVALLEHVVECTAYKKKSPGDV